MNIILINIVELKLLHPNTRTALSNLIPQVCHEIDLHKLKGKIITNK